MTRRFIMVPLELLEPSPIMKVRGRRRAIVVAMIPRTSPTRYAVIAGHDEYWRQIAAGADQVFVEVR